MAKEITNIATRVSFRVRPNGLYRSINHGKWTWIACQSNSLQLRFQNGNILIDEAPALREKVTRPGVAQQSRRGDRSKSPDRAIKRNSNEAVSEAVGEVLRKLVELDGIIEIRRSRRSVRPVANLDQATGFLIKVPGIGPTLVIKSAGLRNWVHGAVPFRRVLAELDAKGQLIRGADGKTTRQVVVPGVGRGRYYCFKTTKTRVPAGNRHSEIPVGERTKPTPPATVAPKTASDSASDDDWGLGSRTAPGDEAASGRRLGSSNRPGNPARGRRTRDMGSVATRRGYRPSKGDWG